MLAVLFQSIMDLRLYANQKVRVITHHEKNNFVDVLSMKNEYGLQITNFRNSMQYIEIREKEGQTAIFTFLKKSHKNEVDFGWWHDAIVVYSKNDVKSE